MYIRCSLFFITNKMITLYNIIILRDIKIVLLNINISKIILCKFSKIFIFILTLFIYIRALSF